MPQIWLRPVIAAENGHIPAPRVKRRNGGIGLTAAAGRRFSPGRERAEDRPRVWLSCPRQTPAKPANTPLVIAPKGVRKVRDALRCYLALSVLRASPCAFRLWGKNGGLS